MATLASFLLSSLNLQTVLVAIVVVLIVFKLREKLRYKLPPGPLAFPFIGNYDVATAKMAHLKYEEYIKKYGPVFTVYFGPTRVIVLNNIDVVTEAMIKKKADFANRPRFLSLDVTTEGYKDIALANYTPTWKLQRKIAGQALRQYMVGDHLEKVVHQSMTKCLDRMATEKQPFNPEPFIDLMVFNILNAVVFGECTDLEDPEFQRFMQLDKEFFDCIGNGLIEDMVPLLANVWPTKRYRRLLVILDELLSILKRKIKEHQDTFDPGNLRDLTDSLIMAIMEANQNEDAEMMSHLTDTHLVQTISDIFFAGIDTSRLTLYFAVRYMAGLRDIQSKVQDELDRVIDRNRLPGLKDRENLCYGEATLHEVMRLGTVIPFGVPHSTLNDTQVGGYDVPKDTTVIINHWALHHDPNYWENVEKFDPHRFLDNNNKLSRKPESWLPFSMGRRVCLGESVAKPELHLIFSAIFQRFHISLAEDGTNDKIEVVFSGQNLEPAPFFIYAKERKH